MYAIRYPDGFTTDRTTSLSDLAEAYLWATSQQAAGVDAFDGVYAAVSLDPDGDDFLPIEDVLSEEEINEWDRLVR